MKTIILIFVMLFALCTTAFAQDSVPAVTEDQTVLRVLAWLGVAWFALSALANVLPKSWPVTRVLAEIATNLRGFLNKSGSRPLGAVLIAMLAMPMMACSFFQDTVVPVVKECSPDRQYFIDNLNVILDGQNAFDVLDGIAKDKSMEFVSCALQRFLERVAASPENAHQRATARAYLEQRDG